MHNRQSQQYSFTTTNTQVPNQPNITVVNNYFINYPPALIYPTSVPLAMPMVSPMPQIPVMQVPQTNNTVIDAQFVIPENATNSQKEVIAKIKSNQHLIKGNEESKVKKEDVIASMIKFILNYPDKTLLGNNLIRYCNCGCGCVRFQTTKNRKCTANNLTLRVLDIEHGFEVSEGSIHKKLASLAKKAASTDYTVQPIPANVNTNVTYNLVNLNTSTVNRNPESSTINTRGINMYFDSAMQPQATVKQNIQLMPVEKSVPVANPEVKKADVNADLIKTQNNNILAILKRSASLFEDRKNKLMHIAQFMMKNYAAAITGTTVFYCNNNQCTNGYISFKCPENSKCQCQSDLRSFNYINSTDDALVKQPPGIQNQLLANETTARVEQKKVVEVVNEVPTSVGKEEVVEVIVNKEDEIQAMLKNSLDLFSDRKKKLADITQFMRKNYDETLTNHEVYYCDNNQCTNGYISFQCPTNSKCECKSDLRLFNYKDGMDYSLTDDSSVFLFGRLYRRYDNVRFFRNNRDILQIDYVTIPPFQSKETLQKKAAEASATPEIKQQAFNSKWADKIQEVKKEKARQYYDINNKFPKVEDDEVTSAKNKKCRVEAKLKIKLATRNKINTLLEQREAERVKLQIAEDTFVRNDEEEAVVVNPLVLSPLQRFKHLMPTVTVDVTEFDNYKKDTKRWKDSEFLNKKMYTDDLALEACIEAGQLLPKTNADELLIVIDAYFTAYQRARAINSPHQEQLAQLIEWHILLLSQLMRAYQQGKPTPILADYTQGFYGPKLLTEKNQADEFDFDVDNKSDSVKPVPYDNQLYMLRHDFFIKSKKVNSDPRHDYTKHKDINASMRIHSKMLAATYKTLKLEQLETYIKMIKADVIAIKDNASKSKKLTVDNDKEIQQEVKRNKVRN